MMRVGARLARTGAWDGWAGKSLKTDGERRCFSHHGVFESSMEMPMMERMRCVGKNVLCEITFIS